MSEVTEMGLTAHLLPAARTLGAMALIGLVGFVLFTSSAAGVPVGTAERIAVYPADAMVVVLGAFLVIARQHALKPARSDP